MSKRKAKTQRELDATADALYRARDSDKWLRLLRPLTCEETAEVLRKVGARVDVDRRRLGSKVQLTGQKGAGPHDSALAHAVGQE